MYGKLMSISDEMMWRYYELLTDVQLAEIDKMKREVHPMQAKKDLAARIVKDFHSADAATKAAEDWAKQFQKHQNPDVVELVSIPFASVAMGSGEAISPRNAPPDVHILAEDSELQSATVIRIDKLLAVSGLADSPSDGARKVKQGAAA